MERRHFAKASGLEFASAIGELRKHKNERQPELALDVNQHVLRERPADHVEAVPLRSSVPKTLFGSSEMDVTSPHRSHVDLDQHPRRCKRDHCNEGVGRNRAGPQASVRHLPKSGRKRMSVT
jgi:hypothetical protein